MKNYVQEGYILALTAPYAVASGTGMLVGSLFGVAVETAAISEVVSVNIKGVYTLAKTAAQAWTVGVKIYWDDATKSCTTAAAAGANKLIGVATVAALSADTTGVVLLSRSFTI